MAVRRYGFYFRVLIIPLTSEHIYIYIERERGYYMAVRRNGFYLRVLIICFQYKKIKSVSPSGHVIFFLL